MSERIFFHHIQKTAGMSLHAAFVDQYGEPAVSPQIYGLTVPEALRVYADKQVIAGHLVAVPGHPVPDGFYSITVLRHPVDRFVSHLFFNLAEMGLPPPPQPVPVKWWDEMLARAERGELAMRDWQVESLYRYGTVGSGTPHAKEKVAAALASLGQFELVGVVEAMSDLLPVIAIECGWDTRPGERRVNTTARRPRADELPRDIANRIAALNAGDLELWRRAGELFAAARSRALSRACGRSAALSRSRPPAPPVSLPDRIELGSREVTLRGCRILVRGEESASARSGETLEAEFDAHWHAPCRDVTLGIRVRDEKGAILFGSNSYLMGYRLSGEPGDVLRARWSLPCPLAPGRYRIDAVLHPFLAHDAICYHAVEPIAEFVLDGFAGVRFDGAVDLRASLALEPLHGVSISHQEPESPSEPLESFDASIEAVAMPPELHPSREYTVEVSVMNSGTRAWPRSPPHPVNLSYHWHDSNGNDVVFDGERTVLPQPLHPSEKLTLRALLVTPAQPGLYTLHWSLVQEGVTWFSDVRASAAAEMEVRISA